MASLLLAIVFAATASGVLNQFVKPGVVVIEIGILTRSSKHESPTSLRTRETQSTRTALCFLPGVDLIIQAHDWTGISSTADKEHQLLLTKDCPISSTADKEHQLLLTKDCPPPLQSQGGWVGKQEHSSKPAESTWGATSPTNNLSSTTLRQSNPKRASSKCIRRASLHEATRHSTRHVPRSRIPLPVPCRPSRARLPPLVRAVLGACVIYSTACGATVVVPL